MNYNPRNWYWAVGVASISAAVQVWSSQAGAFVPITDVGYIAWLATGNQPTLIVSNTELTAVLTVQAPGAKTPS